MVRVLSVGQCGFDQAAIERQLRRAFEVEMTSARTFAKALAELRRVTYGLVLVNRLTDADGSSGLDLVRALKADPSLADVPVMLVSNHPEAQDEARALGALPGFGKAELGSAAILDRLREVLGAATPPTS